MGKLLDRLAEHFWLPWLVCIGLAAATALLPSPEKPLQLLIGLVVLALILIAFCGYMRSYDRFCAELTREQRVTRSHPPRDRVLLVLVAFSLLLMGGALAFFDLGSGLAMPLAASIIVPSQLTARRELDAFRVSLQTAS